MRAQPSKRAGANSNCITYKMQEAGNEYALAQWGRPVRMHGRDMGSYVRVCKYNNTENAVSIFPAY